MELQRQAGVSKGLRLVRKRPSSWTKRKKERFLDTLARTANVTEATRACGMCRDAAYNLRRRDAGFRRDWEKALVEALDVLADRLLEYGLNGATVKIRYQGKVVDEEVRFDPKMALSLLRLHRDTAVRVRDEAAELPVDRDALARDLREKLLLIEARMKRANAREAEPGDRGEQHG
jgi:hypothetical protein